MERITEALPPFKGRLAGFSYLTFLSLPLANSLLLFIGIFSGIAELSMVLWLLVMGVDARRWEDVAARAGILGPIPTQQQPIRDTGGRLEATASEVRG